MTPSGEISGQHETTRQQSKAAWSAVAPGWYAQREELWKASRPVSERMIRRLDPQPGTPCSNWLLGWPTPGSWRHTW
jgi:hypothetical protein